MIRVFYDAGALFIDGREDPMPAGTLVAAAMGSAISISSLHGAAPLVACDFSLIADISGSGFASAASAMAYLAGQFSMRHPPQGFVFPQNAPSAFWQIEHDLGFYPNVSAFDSTGEQIFGAISQVDANNLSIAFGFPTSGIAYLS